MEITYDPTVNAANIYLVARRHALSAESIPFDIEDHMFVFDFDEQNRLISIEVLDARSILPASLLEKASRP